MSIAPAPPAPAGDEGREFATFFLAPPLPGAGHHALRLNGGTAQSRNEHVDDARRILFPFRCSNKPALSGDASVITPRVPLEQNLAEQSTVTGQPVDEARREALKTFGRYAAAAPTAMLLLAPRQGHAGPGDKDEKDKDKKEKDEKDKGGYH